MFLSAVAAFFKRICIELWKKCGPDICSLRCCRLDPLWPRWNCWWSTPPILRAACSWLRPPPSHQGMCSKRQRNYWLRMNSICLVAHFRFIYRFFTAVYLWHRWCQRALDPKVHKTLILRALSLPVALCAVITFCARSPGRRTSASPCSGWPGSRITWWCRPTTSMGAAGERLRWDVASHACGHAWRRFLCPQVNSRLSN